MEAVQALRSEYNVGWWVQDSCPDGTEDSRSPAPSYFSTYFEEQVRQHEEADAPIKTLYIDRDPDTFADICRHLQGQCIAPCTLDG